MIITEFLTARYDEDEERASSGWSSLRDERWERIDEGNSVMTPRGVLADIAAKRAIVEEHTCRCPDPDCGDCGACSGDHHADPTPAPCTTVRLLAQLYADHEDFDEGWRV